MSALAQETCTPRSWLPLSNEPESIPGVSCCPNSPCLAWTLFEQIHAALDFAEVCEEGRAFWPTVNTQTLFSAADLYSDLTMLLALTGGLVILCRVRP